MDNTTLMNAVLNSNIHKYETANVHVRCLKMYWLLQSQVKYDLAQRESTQWMKEHNDEGA